MKSNNSGTEVLGFHTFRSLLRQFPCRHFSYILSVTGGLFEFFPESTHRGLLSEVNSAAIRAGLIRERDSAENMHYLKAYF